MARDHIISNEDTRNTKAGGLGSKFNENYASAYAESPIYKGDMTDDSVRNTWKQGVQSGDVTAAFDAYGKTVDAGTGNKMSSFSVDFTGDPDDEKRAVPNIAENNITADGKTFGDGAGAPTTAYIPPLTSPGPGSLSSGDQPAFTGVTPDPVQQNEFGSGLGGLANPSVTSAEIAEQQVFDGVTALLSGRSYEGSAG